MMTKKRIASHSDRRQRDPDLTRLRILRKQARYVRCRFCAASPTARSADAFNREKRAWGRGALAFTIRRATALLRLRINSRRGRSPRN